MFPGKKQQKVLHKALPVEKSQSCLRTILFKHTTYAISYSSDIFSTLYDPSDLRPYLNYSNGTGTFERLAICGLLRHRNFNVPLLVRVLTAGSMAPLKVYSYGLLGRELHNKSASKLSKESSGDVNASLVMISKAKHDCTRHSYRRRAAYQSRKCCIYSPSRRI